MPSCYRTLPIGSVRVSDPFWTPWQRAMAEHGLPHQWRMCRETGRLENFERAARRETGGYQGLRFNDSDVYKLLEASLIAEAQGLGAPSSEAVQEAVSKVSAAQHDDGYINTYVDLACPHMQWRSVNALHEMYCIGHLVEAAVAESQVGRSGLMTVARRAADHVMRRFPSDGSPMYPGHQELELALARLSSTLGDDRYAEYARWQTLARGTRPSPFEAELADEEVVAASPGVKPLFVKDDAYDGAYAQDDVPLVDQSRAVGHAVRAMYYYSGAVELLPDDPRVRAALERIWGSLTSRQMYVTGGIGSSGRNEGFTDDYDLPNLDAYAETCAAIGLVFWAWRMFCAYGRAEYLDVLERTLFNALLSGVSESCDTYFYDNPLESDGRHKREPWFSCACCPPNIARLLMAIGQYAVAESDGCAVIALPIGGTYRTDAATIEIEADYPWSGEYQATVREPKGLRSLTVRVPAWSAGVTASVNGKTVSGRIEDGLLHIEREWKDGDSLTVQAPMVVQWTTAHRSVLSCAGRAALVRGPLVFCLEQHDLGAAPQHWTASLGAPLHTGKTSIECEGRMDASEGDRLYGPRTQARPVPVSAKFVPYYTWANRGPNAMQVWVRGDEG